MNKSRLVSIKEFIEILNNLSPDYQVRVYDKNKKGPVHPGVKTMRTSRLDRIEESIAKLAEEMRAGFKELRQDIKDINARLDYNGLQIEQINKRLDYNGLKKLPIDSK